MVFRMVSNNATRYSSALRFKRVFCQYQKQTRDGLNVGIHKSADIRCFRNRLKQMNLRHIAMSGMVVVPWLYARACEASDLMETAVAPGVVGMEAEALDVGAVLLGDVALLIMAPLVIYAALKMIWEEQFEESADDKFAEESTSTLIKMDNKELSLGSDFESALSDPFLQDLATKAAANILKSVKESDESCLFDANLHELVVKSDGQDANKKWINDMLSKQTILSESEIEQMTTELMEIDKKLSDEEICAIMSKRTTEKIALRELKRLTAELIKKYGS